MKTVIEMAREAGGQYHPSDDLSKKTWSCVSETSFLERFAALVREDEREKLANGDLEAQCHALQQIGGYWYDGPVRNQWIADTCHEMCKVIAKFKEKQL